MIAKRSIKEYIVENGKPFGDSEIDFLKGFRMGQQFQKQDLLVTLRLEMERNSITWMILTNVTHLIDD